MRTSWYTEMYMALEKYLRLKIPLEIVHFPSVGITSALRKFAFDQNADKKSTLTILTIDLRTSLFTKDPEFNRKEFYRIVASHLGLHFNINKEKDSDANLFQEIESVFNNYIQEKKTILVAIETSAKIDLSLVPDFRDFLMFLDGIRDYSDGAVNILITSTYPVFSDNYPAPMPLISKMYNFDNRQRILKTVKNDIFKDSVEDETLIELIEFCGGLPAIVKYLHRDLSFYFLKPEAIFEKELNKEFFDSFHNLTMRLQRIFEQLHPCVNEVLYKKAVRLPLNESEEKIEKEYLQATGILDSRGNIRGQLLPAYIRRVLYSDRGEPKQIHNPVIALGADTDSLGNDVRFLDKLQLNEQYTVDPTTGEIYSYGNKLEEYLSEKELAIVTLLFQNKGKAVSRVQIADSIWQSNGEEYSDWAIDKLISRIREKLTDRKPYRLIRTYRKVGFAMR